MNQNFKPTAIPLATTDPYFSIWSFSNCLTDDVPRHWTGRSQMMLGALLIDGISYRFFGKYDNGLWYFPAGNVLEQTGLTVTPTASIFTFSHPTCDLKVTFLTPLLLDRPEVFSRPVSYIFYEITPKEEGHTFEVYFDASVELCGDAAEQKIDCFEKEGHVWMGAHEQNVLCRSGDNLRIEWGYLHLVHPTAKIGNIYHRKALFAKRTSKYRFKMDLSQPVEYNKTPILYARSEKLSDVFVIAYDDDKSIQYYHENIDCYYKTVYGDFDTMLQAAINEAYTLRADCEKFDAELMAKMEKVSPDYAKLGALAYRQSVAAHKLVEIDGKLMFFSKENFSNGCMATLDVTYPSIPLFLVYNPELVRAMMRPLFAFARHEKWKFPYAPHDCGCYPHCNGQVYSRKNGVLYEEDQMPIEECGNAILTVAAAIRADGDRSLAEENRDLLTQWADYLVEFGYDPGNQLCTDDFAGHLARNCNLSVKAIVALGAFAQMFGEEKYAVIAKDMAERWTKDAKRECGKGWRLTFDHDETWSMKYNMIWDRLLGLDLFAPEVFEEEVDVYTEKMNRYGVPLDSRADYTKLDWMAWTTVMTDRPDYTKAVYESILRMVEESIDRVPLTDWYDTVSGRIVSFQHRTVQGGLFMRVLY